MLNKTNIKLICRLMPNIFYQLNIFFFFLITLEFCLSCIYFNNSSCFFLSSSIFFNYSSFIFAANSLYFLMFSNLSLFFYFSSSFSWLFTDWVFFSSSSSELEISFFFCTYFTTGLLWDYYYLPFPPASYCP